MSNLISKKQLGGVTRFYNDYLNSPKYKERLNKMDYKNPQQVIKDRLGNINSTKVVEQEEKPGLYKQLINKINNTPYSTSGSSYLNNTVIFDKKQAKDIKADKGSILSHEFGHAELAGFPLRHIENKQISLRLKRDSKLKEHDYKPDENKSDINGLRYELKQQGLYDAGTQDMNLDILKKAKPSFIKNRLLNNYKPDNLIWLMNNIASNINPTNDMSNG